MKSQQISIPLSKPSITDLEISLVTDAVTRGWGAEANKYIDKLERIVEDEFKVTHALATSSCTGAITLALSVFGVGKGDEVVLADANWIAALSPVLHAGAKPVFADVSEHDWCMTAQEVRRKITSRTKAIIVTHLYGNVAPIEDILSLARSNGIYVLEDSAEAIGSRIRGRACGTFGDIGVFSLHGSKTATSGEGGILVTNDSKFNDMARILNNHGRLPSEQSKYTATYPGYKFKMSNIQAAIAFGQMTRLEALVNRKREIFNIYKSELDGFLDCSMNPETAGCINSYWMPTICFPKGYEGIADFAIESMVAKGIQARPFFPPLSESPFADDSDAAVSKSLAKRCINLPSFNDISQREIGKVVSVLKKSARSYNSMR